MTTSAPASAAKEWNVVRGEERDGARERRGKEKV